MYNYDLIIKDAEFFLAGNEFKVYSAILEDIIEQYKLILDNVTTNAISSGEVHDALMLFKNYITKLKVITEQIGEKFNKITNDFITEIERTDDYLYDAGISDVIRDFSNEEYEHLQDCLDDPWSSVTDSIGDWIYGKVINVIDFFNWNSAKTYLSKCHRNLLDYNDETAQGLKILFDRVYAIDAKYGKSIAGAIGNDDYLTSCFSCVVITMCDIRNMLDTMAEVINPRYGEFTIDKINSRVGTSYNELLTHFDQLMAIPEIDSQPAIIEISNFAVQPWANSYFSHFSYVTSMFVTNIGGYETFKMVVFNMFDISKNTFIYGNFEEYITKKQLLATLGDLSKNYKYSESKEQKIIEECKEFISELNEYSSDKYKELNTTYGENGKLLLDGRTKKAIQFREFLNTLERTENILTISNEGIEYLTQLFIDYKKGLEILESFQKNYTGDETVLKSIIEIRNLYNKEFGAWASKALEEAREIGYDIGLKKLANGVPVFAVVTAIDEGINTIGEVIGLGSESKSMYDALAYYQLYNSSATAYRNALDKFQDADPSSKEYEVLATDLNNCFNLNKKNMIEMFNAMSNASTGIEKSYYHYCAKQAEEFSMRDTSQPNILTYDQFVTLNTDM